MTRALLFLGLCLILLVPLWLPVQGPLEAHVPEQALPESLSECDDPLQYLEPDLAETNPTAFAQKLQVCWQTAYDPVGEPWPRLICVL